MKSVRLSWKAIPIRGQCITTISALFWMVNNYMALGVFVDAFLVQPPARLIQYQQRKASADESRMVDRLFAMPAEGDDYLDHQDHDDAIDDEDDGDDEDLETLFSTSVEEPPLDNLEKAWRFAKKPLLRIGSKGATLSHGNSLRQLLDSHTVVKVKVNTRRFDGSLEEAFKALRSLAEESGAVKGIELIQARDSENMILFGMPGTMKRIEKGSFPLPPEANEEE